MDLQKQLEKTMTAAGHRLTRCRQAVISVISAIDAHFEAADIIERTRDGNRPVSRATVYRTLDLLQGLGLICEVHSDDLHSHYEPVPAHQHYHLICRECGKTVEFADERIQDVLQELCRRHEFLPAVQRLEVTGLCSACREPDASADPPTHVAPHRDLDRGYGNCNTSRK